MSYPRDRAVSSHLDPSSSLVGSWRTRQLVPARAAFQFLWRVPFHFSHSYLEFHSQVIQVSTQEHMKSILRVAEDAYLHEYASIRPCTILSPRLAHFRALVMARNLGHSRYFMLKIGAHKRLQACKIISIQHKNYQVMRSGRKASHEMKENGFEITVMEGEHIQP